MTVKVLITGVAGFLGSRLCRRLQKDYHVLAPLRQELDLTDREQVKRYFGKEAPQVTVHCAAVSNTRACETEPALAQKVNVDATGHIAAACRENGSKLVFCSSDQIYGGCKEKHAHTEQEAAPVTQYAKMKLEAEEICLGCLPDAVLLRLSWMYDTQSLNAAQHGDFFRDLLSEEEQGRRISYPVHDYRGITYVNDALQNMEKAFALPGGVYNFGSPNDKSTYDTVRELLEKTGRSLGTLDQNTSLFAESPRNLCMDQKKALKYGLVFPNTLNGLIRCMEMRNEV